MKSKGKIILAALLLAFAAVLLYRHVSPSLPPEARRIPISGSESEKAKEFAIKLVRLSRDDRKAEFGRYCARKSDVNLPDYYKSVRAIDPEHAVLLKVEANETDPEIHNVYFRNADGRRCHFTIDSKGPGGEYRFISYYVYSE